MTITADVCHCLCPPSTGFPTYSPAPFISSHHPAPLLPTNDNFPLLMLWFAFPHTSFTHFLFLSSLFFFLPLHPQGDPAVTCDRKGSIMQKLSNPTAATGGFDSNHLVFYFAHLHFCNAMRSLKYFGCSMPSVYLCANSHHLHK